MAPAFPRWRLLITLNPGFPCPSETMALRSVRRSSPRPRRRNWRPSAARSGPTPTRMTRPSIQRPLRSPSRRS